VIRITTGTLAKLRDRLRDRGMRASVAMSSGSHDQALATELADTYGPLCEAMYVMMAADGTIAGAERDVLRGAMRELDERVRSVHVEAMLSRAAAAVASQGAAERIRALAREIGDDRARAEAAFLLAAAVAYADDTVVLAEQQALQALAEALAIPTPRAHELFNSLEQVDDLLGRDPAADPIDVLLHTAARVGSPEDFERLAAMTNREELRILLRLYATFVRSGEEMRDKAESTPRSLSAAGVGALMSFVGALPQGMSERANAVRATLARLAQSLSEADTAAALEPLVTSPSPPTILGTLEDASATLAQHTFIARRKYGASGLEAPELPIAEIARLVRRVVDGDEWARASLVSAVHDVALASIGSLPASVSEVITLVLARLVELPVRLSGAPAVSPLREAGLPEWLPNKRTLGGFYVHRRLGAGGTATVFVVTRSDEKDDPNADCFALKVPQYDGLAARAVSEAEFLKMFREEAGALLLVPEHPNLTRFITFDAGARPKPILVMELVGGTPCDQMLDWGSLTTSRVLAVLDGVLAGLEVMHGVGIGHLDLKPANIVVRDDGVAVLVDFGLAGRKLRPGCCTANYGGPEVWGVSTEGATPMTADVYSFGCLAFEALTGKVLFDGSHELALVTAHVTHDGRPEGVAKMASDPRMARTAALLSHCLRKEPKDRPDIAMLRRALRGLTPQIAAMPWPWVPA
jgi:hypothetical protein